MGNCDVNIIHCTHLGTNDALIPTMKRSVFLCLALYAIPSLSSAIIGEGKYQANSIDNDGGGLLLLVVFDGFRYDYLDAVDTPNFDRLIKSGAKPSSVVPAFATKTFPGHHTIATGLYQESHGILGNKMYDPDLDAFFTQATSDPVWWSYGGEPIWVTNQRNGGRSVSVFYPGARVNISGQPATFHQPTYDETMPFNDRIDLVVELMKNGSANLGLLYFHEPDSTGHLQGPESPALRDVIQDCDVTLGYLLDQLADSALTDVVNVIVTSDHGMAEVSADQTVFLDEFVDRSLYFYTDNDPVFGIWAYNENDTHALYDQLNAQHPNMSVYLREAIPEGLHYRDNRRVSPILVVMDEGWHVWTNSNEAGNWQRYRGNHGFLNTLPSQHTIFIASGPAFKRDHALDNTFELVDIYNLMCHVLDISPAPNNGTFSNVEWLLVDGEDTSTVTTPTVGDHTTDSSGVRLHSSTEILIISFLVANVFRKKAT